MTAFEDFLPNVLFVQGKNFGACRNTRTSCGYCLGPVRRAFRHFREEYLSAREGARQWHVMLCEAADGPK